MWRNATLAATWRRLVADAEAAGPDRETQIQAGRDAFLRGFVAEAIADFVARAEVMDSSGRRNRGLLSGDDMAAFSASYEPPVTFEHRGLTVCKAGPWSQGPVQLQALALLEGFDLEAMGHLSADYVHTVLECAKLAFADREAWYGDPAFADVPLETLVSGAYAVGAPGARGRGGVVRPAAGVAGRAVAGAARGSRLLAEAVAAGFGVGEPTLGRADGPGRGRHVPRRRRRPAREHGLGDAERRLAALLPRDPGPRPVPGHARADVLADRGAAERARAGQAPAHDADPVARRCATARA